MKKLMILMICISVLVIAGCGSSNESNNDNGGAGGDEAGSNTSQGIRIVGSASGYDGSALRMISSSKFAAPGNCPDDTNGGFSLSLSPQEGSFKLATKYVRFLKEGSDTEYYELPGCIHETAPEAEEEAVALGSSDTTICELDSEIPEEAAGTYDGIEMAIYYVEMTLPMIVPQISDEVDFYPLRVYYNDDTANGISARDILIYDEAQGKWGYVNWDDTSELTYVDEGRPGALLDAFANDNFWCANCTETPELCPEEESDRQQCSAQNPDWSYKETITLSTRDDSGWADFRMEGSFTIEAGAEAHTISLAFNVADTLAVWENADDIDDAEHTLNVIMDCGFHPTFPSADIGEIDDASEENETESDETDEENTEDTTEEEPEEVEEM